MIGIYREMVSNAVQAGASYIQFDFPIYPMLVDRCSVEALEELGEDLDSLLAKAIEADAAVARNVPPACFPNPPFAGSDGMVRVLTEQVHERDRCGPQQAADGLGSAHRPGRSRSRGGGHGPSE